MFRQFCRPAQVHNSEKLLTLCQKIPPIIGSVGDYCRGQIWRWNVDVRISSSQTEIRSFRARGDVRATPASTVPATSILAMHEMCSTVSWCFDYKTVSTWWWLWWLRQ